MGCEGNSLPRPQCAHWHPSLASRAPEAREQSAQAGSRGRVGAPPGAFLPLHCPSCLCPHPRQAALQGERPPLLAEPGGCLLWAFAEPGASGGPGRARRSRLPPTQWCSRWLRRENPQQPWGQAGLWSCCQTSQQPFESSASAGGTWRGPPPNLHLPRLAWLSHSPTTHLRPAPGAGAGDPAPGSQLLPRLIKGSERRAGCPLAPP